MVNANARKDLSAGLSLHDIHLSPVAGRSPGMPDLKLVSRLFPRVAFVALAALALGACEDAKYRTTSNKHNVPLTPELYSLMSQNGMRRENPVLIRSFKKESEMEIWKQTSAGDYKLLKTYPMCRWSGQLGPKKREGDRMAPEGFYPITPAQMNPNSSYHLAFNMGFPNAYDRQLGRSGNFLMVHGACSSMGCYSMTDDQIQEIYALVREAHNGGQRSVQMQAMPFRMTPENMAKHRLDSNIAFWKNLKEGSDIFEATRREPQVAACSGKYGFNGECGTPRMDSSAVAAIQDKRSRDEARVAELVARGTPAIRLVYDDGDQHKSFKQILASSGAASLNASTSWSSRDVGISRIEALTAGPTVVVLDGKGNQRGAARAQSADSDAVLAAASSAETATPLAAAAAPVAATPRPAAPRTVAAAASARPVATTQVARSAAPAPAAPVAAAPAAQQPSVMSRVMSLNPFASSPAPATGAQAAVQ
jgi:murein L,D-transpeptidase YafK